MAASPISRKAGCGSSSRGAPVVPVPAAVPPAAPVPAAIPPAAPVPAAIPPAAAVIAAVPPAAPVPAAAPPAAPVPAAAPPAAVVIDLVADDPPDVIDLTALTSDDTELYSDASGSTLVDDDSHMSSDSILYLFASDLSGANDTPEESEWNPDCE